jgi:NAD(P)-dependent dehydrogenase (short-subunit alcohol dehydrogenase family)
MDLERNDKLAIVTGGSRGIGRAAAALLAEGPQVVISSVQPDSVKRAVEALEPLRCVAGIACDVAIVSRYAACRAADVGSKAPEVGVSGVDAGGVQAHQDVAVFARPR